jgi:hypothetical protein
LAPLPAVREIGIERQGSTLNSHLAAPWIPIARIVIARLAAVSDLAYVKQDDMSQARKWLRRTKHHW